MAITTFKRYEMKYIVWNLGDIFRLNMVILSKIIVYPRREGQDAFY